MLMLGGCCGLLVPLSGFGLFAAASLFTKARKRREITWLLQSFVLGHDRSQALVSRIADVLLVDFSHSVDHQELASAVASYVPAGTRPFLNEAALVEVFREFLWRQYRVALAPPDDSGAVWPPALRPF